MRSLVVHDDDDERHDERNEQQNSCGDRADCGVHVAFPLARGKSVALCGRRLSAGRSIRAEAASNDDDTDEDAILINP